MKFIRIMLHKPIENRHPDGIAAYNKVSSKTRYLPITHLGTKGFKIEGELFIPQKWRLGAYLLSPNITNQGSLFRGESFDFDEDGNIPLKYSKNRIDSFDPVKRAYNRLRWFDLRRLLNTNPMYRMLSRGIKNNDEKDTVFRLSISALLHSYGVPSSYVSLTSDLKTALFYAVTDYDEELKRFVPTKKKYGILSYYELHFPITPISRIRPLGLQVFERPGLNKEFLCRLNRDEDYYNLPLVEGYVFEQNENVSNMLLDEFEKGWKLCPSDDILVDRIRLSDGVVSMSAINFVERMYPHSKINLDEVREHFKVVESLDEYRYYFSFTKEELEMYYSNIEFWWYQFCGKIYFDAAPELDESLMMNLPYDSRYSKYFKQCRI